MGPDICGMNKCIRQIQNLAGMLCFYFHIGVNHEPFHAEYVTGALQDIQNVLHVLKELKKPKGRMNRYEGM